MFSLCRGKVYVTTRSRLSSTVKPGISAELQQVRLPFDLDQPGISVHIMRDEILSIKLTTIKFSSCYKEKAFRAKLWAVSYERIWWLADL